MLTDIPMKALERVLYFESYVVIEPGLTPLTVNQLLTEDEYQDAIDQALSEADQTGWYIPPEAAEMFKQQEIARQIASKPDATYEEKQRAEQVNKACQAYYDNLGFQRGYAYDKDGNVVTEYYGIKTLSTLTYEETVRNNKINEELQREANNISRQNLAATWKSIELQEKNLKLGWYIQNQNEISRITEKGTKQNKVSIGSEKSPSLASTNVYINGQLYRVPNWNTNDHVMLDSNWSFYQQGQVMYATDGTKMVKLTKYDE